MIKIELDRKRIAEFVDAIEKGRLYMPPLLLEVFKGWRDGRGQKAEDRGQRTDRTDGTNGTYENGNDGTGRTDGKERGNGEMGRWGNGGEK